MAEKGKTAVNKWHFCGKKQVIGSEKITSRQPSRKAKWCEMQATCAKTDKKRRPRRHNLWINTRL